MSSQNQASTYLGFWTDWTEGKFSGATWTLSHRDGSLLASFTAIFTTFVFAQLWTIFTFALHHARSTRYPEDGLKHQRQAVLRNTGALASAVCFAKQIISWHGKAERAKMRSLGWSSLALCFAAAAGLASTFSGYAASKSSLNRLVVSDDCGYTTYTDGTGHIVLEAYSSGVLKDSIAAANYARTCYVDGENSSGQCKRYIRPKLNWTGTYNTPCPFQSGMCSNGDQASFTLLSEHIDSLTGLGINSPSSDRLSLQKRMTCSAIREIHNYNQVGNLVYYNFGSIGIMNFTYVYSRLARGSLLPYSLISAYSYAGLSSEWSPVQALNRTDADVSIVFIGMNSVTYPYPNNDPVFSATTKNSSVNGFYVADYDVSTLACAEQYQVCNPAVQSSGNVTAGCTPWMGADQLLHQTDYLASKTDVSNTAKSFASIDFWKRDEARLSARQIAILQRIAWDTVSELVQTAPLSDNYWTSEVGWWFDACLARLQEGIIDFAAGPTNADVNNSTTLFADEETKKLCKNQLTHDTGDGTINFSALALGIIYFVGLVIVVLSLYVDRVYKKFLPKTHFKTRMWEEDGFMLLHRGAFAAATAAAATAVGGHSGVENSGAETEEERPNIVTWTSDKTPVTTQREKMVHFSIPSSTSYSRLSDEAQEESGEARSDKDVARVSVDATRRPYQEQGQGQDRQER